MKILFVLENYYPNIGGVETLFKALVDKVTKDGYKVTIITNKTNANLPFKETRDNLKILRFPFLSRYLFTFLAWIPATYHAFKNDIIHTTSYNAGIPAFIASVISRKKVIITFHEVWGKLWFELPFMNKFILSLHYLFEKFLLSLPFDRFVAVSNFTMKKLVEHGVSSERVEMIYNGIDYLRYNEFNAKYSSNLSREESRSQFVYFGRLGISKGLDLLLRAMKGLKAKDVACTLLLIIPTQPRTFRREIEGLISSYSLGDRITLKSNLSSKELMTSVKGSLASVIPSYSEGFCFTAVESMALGVPVISSNNGALAEVLSGKFLRMKEFTSEALQIAMEQALLQNWDAELLRKFELKETVQSYKQLYKNFNN